jgi:hypothetical protein
LDGQHLETSCQLMEWLAATARGWNAVPAPFVWGGKRQRRRWRVRQRRHALGGSGAVTRGAIFRHRPHPNIRAVTGARAAEWGLPA